MKKKASKSELKKKQSEAGKKAYQTKMANLAKKNGTSAPSEMPHSGTGRKIIELYGLLNGKDEYAGIKKAIEDYLTTKI